MATATKRTAKRTSKTEKYFQFFLTLPQYQGFSEEKILEDALEKYYFLQQKQQEEQKKNSVLKYLGIKKGVFPTPKDVDLYITNERNLWN